MEKLSQSDIEQIARGAFRRPSTAGGENKPGDMRISRKLIEFRQQFAFPRSTVAKLAGVSLTSITRIELGQRMFSAHSLSGLIIGLREGVRMLFPRRVREYDKWAFEMLEVVHTVEEEQRLERRRRMEEDDE